MPVDGVAIHRATTDSRYDLKMKAYKNFWGRILKNVDKVEMPDDDLCGARAISTQTKSGFRFVDSISNAL